MPFVPSFRRPAAVLGLIFPGLVAVCAGPSYGDPPRRDPVLERRVGASPRGVAPVLYRADLPLADTLGVGRVSADVVGQLPVLEALTTVLDQKAAVLGYARVRPVIARDRHEMTDFLEQGLVDVVSEEPLEAMHHVEELGATVLLRESRGARNSIRTVVFVRRDSPLQALADLKGARVVLAGGDSGAEFLMPLAALRDAGLGLRREEDTGGGDRGEGTYTVSPAGASAVRTVLRRQAGAGAISDEQWDREQGEGNTRELRVLHTFPALPRAVLVAGAGVGAERGMALRRLLLELQETADGKERLAPFSSFVEPEGTDADAAAEWDRTRRLYASVREEVR